MARSQPYTISCDGGLINTSNSLELLKTPGFATKLRNFEVNISGGYRRINGYEKFGGASAVQPNGTEDVLGIFVYGDGVVVCSGTDIFFSEDGTSWLQINKLSATGGDNYTTFTGKSATTRTNQGQCTFALFESNHDYGQLIIADGANKPFSFRMEGTGALTTRTFFTEEIDVDGSNSGVKYITIHDHHLVAGGVVGSESTVYWSRDSIPNDFVGSGSGNAVLPDKIRGLKSFRQDRDWETK